MLQENFSECFHESRRRPNRFQDSKRFHEVESSLVLYINSHSKQTEHFRETPLLNIFTIRFADPRI
eukprot:snap_masked-scaffold_101-processed-gene-0.18-mRNA-1 protein AED:1.00 eAED:1.00 QI:0/0/0/0/1/1/2/0/65